MTKTGSKGLIAEELVRAYFLRAGFFVVRGAPLRAAGDDLTDVDLWAYERSSIAARRRIVIDIKDRKTPQAAERLYFISGVASILGVEGAGVATTDTRPHLRALALKHDVLWIDGNDMQRLKASGELTGLGRISEELLIEQLNVLDSGRAERRANIIFSELKSSVLDRFGAASGNAALDAAQTAGIMALKSHPNSPAAEAAVRLFYLSVAIACASLDFALAPTALRPGQERVKQLVEAIRFGAEAEEVEKRIDFTRMAVRASLPNGNDAARTITERLYKSLADLPVEGLAEVFSKLLRGDVLFNIAKGLERAAYAGQVPSFDSLDLESKAIVGAVLDFAKLNRAGFAKCWSNNFPMPLVPGDKQPETLSAASLRAGDEQQKLL